MTPTKGRMVSMSSTKGRVAPVTRKGMWSPSAHRKGACPLGKERADDPMTSTKVRASP